MTLQRVLDLYDRWGNHRYDEELSQLAHGLQCADLARQHGAADSLVAAALLHDVGHLLGLERRAGDVDVELNDRHDATGANYLSGTFGPDVTEPIRWHVHAKRYLCAVEANYVALLSEASIRSLQFQGGTMTPEEVAEFEMRPFFNDAVQLRRWDEGGKDLTRQVAGLDDFTAMLRALSH